VDQHDVLRVLCEKHCSYVEGMHVVTVQISGLDKFRRMS
jgi:hypothetical protein